MKNFKKYIEEDKAGKSLADKAKKTGISSSTLRKVYNRGVAAWKTGHRPGTTPSQWGHARVNAFITKKKRGGLNHDKDLAQEKKMPLKVKDGMGAWIRDFQDSKAKQFKGRSKDERRDQAIAAYLSAKRGPLKQGTDYDPDKDIEKDIKLPLVPVPAPADISPVGFSSTSISIILDLSLIHI